MILDFCLFIELALQSLILETKKTPDNSKSIFQQYMTGHDGDGTKVGVPYINEAAKDDLAYQELHCPI